MPVYSSHLVPYSDLNIGVRIREVRQRLGFTLHDLAARSGFSTARLSQIENEEHVLDVDQAFAIAAALDTPLESLLPPDRNVPYEITREEQVHTREPRESFGSPVTRASGGRRAISTGRLPTCSWDGRWTRCSVGSCPQRRRAAGRAASRPRVRVRAQGRHRIRHRHADGDRASRTDARRLHLLPMPTSPTGCDRSAPNPPRACTCSPPRRRRCAHRSSGCRPARCDQAATVTAASEASSPFSDPAQGRTVKSMARLLDLSERQLRQIEEGRRGVRLDTMMTFARAFGRPLRHFIRNGPQAEPYYFIQRAADISRIPGRQATAPSRATEHRGHLRLPAAVARILAPLHAAVSPARAEHRHRVADAPTSTRSGADLHPRRTD